MTVKIRGRKYLDYLLIKIQMHFVELLFWLVTNNSIIPICKYFFGYFTKSSINHKSYKSPFKRRRKVYAWEKKLKLVLCPIRAKHELNSEDIFFYKCNLCPAAITNKFKLFYYFDLHLRNIIIILLCKQ